MKNRSVEDAQAQKKSVFKIDRVEESTPVISGPTIKAKEGEKSKELTSHDENFIKSVV